VKSSPPNLASPIDEKNLEGVLIWRVDGWLVLVQGVPQLWRFARPSRSGFFHPFGTL